MQNIDLCIFITIMMTIEMHREVKMLEAVNATEGKKEFLQLIERCKENPFLITKNGKPVAVLMNIETYEKMMETLKFYIYSEIKNKIDE